MERNSYYPAPPFFRSVVSMHLSDPTAIIVCSLDEVHYASNHSISNQSCSLGNKEWVAASRHESSLQLHPALQAGQSHSVVGILDPLFKAPWDDDERRKLDSLFYLETHE